MYPMRCGPVFKQYIWGGNKLKTVLLKSYEAPDMAESWELSCHEDGMSTVLNGAFAGRRLRDILEEHPDYMGDCVEAGGEFPLLIKFLDANDKLSIQVHPTRECADASLGEQSKTEIWVVMDSVPGAALYCGLNREISQEEFKRRANEGSICEVLNLVPAKKGDVFHILAGTVHAIGEGLLVAEIQQSANTTFRVFDYNRTNELGEQRELHVEKAARAAKLTPVEGKPADIVLVEDNEAFTHEILFDSQLFFTERIAVKDRIALEATTASFEALLFIEGQGTIVHCGEAYPAQKGDCYFIPARMGHYEITGPCCVLRNKVL